MKLKKIITGVLSLCLAASTVVGLSGCGNGVSEDTLVWYMIGDEPEAHDEVMAKANEIIYEKIGMKVDMRYIDSASYQEKMKLKMASGEAYDLAWAGYANPYINGVNMGGFYDITDLIAETGLDEVVSQFYFDSATVNGRIYGVPNVQVVSNPNAMGVQQRIVDECGLQSYIDEIDELSNIHASYADLEKVVNLYTEMFAKIKSAHPEMTAFEPSGTLVLGSLPVYEIIQQPVVLRKDGSTTTLELDYETEEWKLGVKAMCDWYKSGYIRSDIASATIDDSKETRTKHAFGLGNWKPGSPEAEAKRYGEEFAHILVFDPYVSKSSITATITVVGADSKHPKEAVELIKLINTDEELFKLITWGIEGEHYTLNEDGTAHEIEGAGYEGIGNSAWKYGNAFNTYVGEGQPADTNEQTKKMNEDADKSPALGFTVDQTNIQTELANVTSVTAEYKAKIYYGIDDFDSWYDEYVTKMENAGAKKVLEEVQRQYDEFLASKN